MSKYESDRSWSDRHLPEVYKIVGPLLMEPSTFELDANESCDLTIIKAKDMRIGVRIRRPDYLKFKNDITIRASRDSGAKTELSKIMYGFGDWIFYGHSGGDNSPFIVWHLMDLDKWRHAMMTDRYTAKAAREYIPNGDGTHFVAFNVNKMPEGVIIATGGTGLQFKLKAVI